MRLYLATTKDEYELPIAVADSPSQLADLLGVKRERVNQNLSKKIKGWYKIDIEEEESENGNHADIHSVHDAGSINGAFRPTRTADGANT